MPPQFEARTEEEAKQASAIYRSTQGGFVEKYHVAKPYGDDTTPGWLAGNSAGALHATQDSVSPVGRLSVG